MEFLKKNRINIIIIAVCVALEIIISNFSAMAIVLGGYKGKTLDLSSALLADNRTRLEYNDGTLYAEEGVITFENINEKVKNVYILLNNSENRYKKVNLAFTDDNFAFSDGFDYNHGTFYLYLDKESECFLNYASYGEVKSLRITVDGGVNDTLAIREISVNKPQSFHISILRLLIFLGISFIVRYGIWKITVSEKSYSYKVLAGIAAAVCVLTCFTAVLLTKNPDTRLLSEYDPNNPYSDDQYEQLFYAFSQGRVSLDIDFDAESFENIENIYDRSERNEYGIHGAFWDRAYYDGRFYSYFGAAPVFTVYYPVYIVTRCVPTPILASMMLALYAQVFVSLLYITVIRRFCKDAPLVLAAMGLAAVLFGSLILPLAFELQFYYMAVLSGIGSFAAFLYFLLSAYYAVRQKNRLIYLALTGAAVVMIVASRPTLLLYCFIAVVPAYFIFTDKSIKKSLKVYYTTALAVPVLIGAVLIMMYNYVRFGSAFEFGFNYQLTVSMAKANTITIGMLPGMIYHYFFQQPDFSTNFPYFTMRNRALELYPRYNYNGRIIGMFCYPLTWGIFLLPFTDKKKDKFRTAFTLALTALAFVLTFVDMCKAGVHYRYTADIMMPLLMVGIITIFDILDKSKKSSQSFYGKAYVCAAAVLAVTFIVGFLMMFCNETANLMGDYAFVSRIFYKG